MTTQKQKNKICEHTFAKTGNTYRIEQDECIFSVYKNGEYVGVIGFCDMAEFIENKRRELEAKSFAKANAIMRDADADDGEAIK